MALVRFKGCRQFLSFVKQVFVRYGCEGDLFLLKDSRLRWPSSASVSGLRYKKIDREDGGVATTWAVLPE